MLRYKVKNYVKDEKEVTIEIEEECSNTLIYGLNILVEDKKDADYLVNITLTHTQVLELYKMLTEKMCSTQVHMLDTIKNRHV